MARTQRIAPRGNRSLLLLVLAASWIATIGGTHDAASNSRPDLDQIVHSITTVSEFPDGTTHSNTGSGFVVGSSFFTVQHNLAARPARGVRVTTYLEGVALEPTHSSTESDLAIFELPGELCDRFCNDLTLERVPDLREHQTVRWLRKVQGDRRWRSGRVLNYALLGTEWGVDHAASPRGCDENLIVEVDTPFIRGSSGSPVLDEDSGQIIGIIQGSIHRPGAPSGFFKPIDCVMRLVSETH